MAKPRNKTVDYATYLLGRVGVMLIQCVPLWLNFFGAKVVGWCLFHLDAKHRRRAVGHLQKSFPDWSEDRCRRVAGQSFRHFACMAVETVLASRKVRPESYPRYFRMKNMAEMIRLQVSHDGGLVLLTGHFGNWEAAGHMTAVIGLPTVTIARRVNNPYMNRYILSLRERGGQRMVDKTGAGAEIGEAMEQNKTVSIVFDQDAGPKGVFVDFFGRKASTYKSIGLMAMTYQTPIVVVYCRRLDEAYHFEVGAQRIIHPQEWADKDDPLKWITQEYTAALEQVIRTDPAQYFWMHRRWKQRPRGEAKAPDGIS